MAKNGAWPRSTIYPVSSLLLWDGAIDNSLPLSSISYDRHGFLARHLGHGTPVSTPTTLASGYAEASPMLPAGRTNDALSAMACGSA